MFEAGGGVIRVGIQGTHDGVGRVVGAGFARVRELVECRRMLDVLRERLRQYGRER